MPWTRRAFLASSLAVACTPAPCEVPCAPCDDRTLKRIVDAILTTDRADLLLQTGDWLADGIARTDIAHAAFIAGLQASSAQTHSNHPVKAVEAARQIATALPDTDGVVALMWAVDTVSSVPNGIRNPRDTGTPLGELDEALLPANPARTLDDAFAAFDPETAQAAVVALLRERGRDAVVEALTVWGGRNLIPNGHYAIAVAQYLRMLDAHDWRCGEWALRHAAWSIATDPTLTSNASLWQWGEDAFQANRERARAIAPSWEDGAPDDGAALDLLADLRGTDLDEAADLATTALADGLSPDSIWDAVLLHAAEAVVYGGDEHAVTSVAALRDLYVRCPDRDGRLVLLLQAPGWASNMTVSTGGIAELEPETPPDDPAEIPAQPGAITGLRMALGWLAEGRSEDALVEATNRHIVRNHAEWHGYKVPVALAQGVDAVSPTFRPLLRAAHATAYSRGEPPWDRYEEAVEAAS